MMAHSRTAQAHGRHKAAEADALPGLEEQKDLLPGGVPHGGKTRATRSQSSGRAVIYEEFMPLV